MNEVPCGLLLLLLVGCTVASDSLTYNCFETSYEDSRVIKPIYGNNNRPEPNRFGRADNVHTMVINADGEVTSAAITECPVEIFVDGTLIADKSMTLTLRGRTVIVNYEARNTGYVDNIKIQFQDISKCTWHPRQVKITNEAKVEYMCQRMLDLPPPSRSYKRKRRSTDTIDLKVDVYTAAALMAGTAAHVFITIHGWNGDDSERYLGNSFDLGKQKTKILRVKDVGKMKAITIRHDNTGGGAGWKLDNVTIYESGNEIGIFKCDCWLKDHRGLSKRIPNQKVLCTSSGSQCGTHGSCQGSGAQSSCKCKGDYTGTFCTKPPCTPNGDECGSHGSCNTDDSASFCLCSSHYSGTYCTVPPCTQDGGECREHGVCNTNGTSNICECIDDYTGPHCTNPPCTLDGGECGSHGVCNTNGSANVCECTDDYTGTHCTEPPCTQDRDECGSSGTCNTDGFANVCECDDDHTGVFCTITSCTADGDECGSQGSCNTDESSPVCECTGGYSGTFCTIPPCTNNGTECGDHGSCDTTSSTVTCECSDGYTGTFCDKGGDVSVQVLVREPVPKRRHLSNKEAPVCTTGGDECKNAGKCVTDGSSRRCQCPAGYTGITCGKASTDEVEQTDLADSAAVMPLYKIASLVPIFFCVMLM